MKWYQKLNPFYLRACLEAADQDVENFQAKFKSAILAVDDLKSKLKAVEQDRNYLRSSLDESNRKLELRTEEYEEALRQLTVCRENQPRYAELKGRNECLSNANSHLNEALQEKTIEVKQLCADLKVCKAEPERSKVINAKWFETVLGYGVNDMTLLNQSFWGKNLELVELGDDKVS